MTTPAASPAPRDAGSAPPAPAPAADRRKWFALAGLALSLLVVGLDLTVLNVALPTLATSLHASTSQLQWFANAYNLALAVMLLPGGLLGDRFGRKKMILTALVAFGVASAFCAFSGSAGQLIAWRVVLGVGAALLIPLSMSVLAVLFTEEERPRAIAIWATANMLGIPLGPILGGWLLDHFWWGSVFLINLPVVVVAVLAVAFLMPETRSATPPRFDVPGILLSGVGLAALTYGLIEAGAAGWGSATAVVSIGVGAVALAAFVLQQRRTAESLIDLNLFKSSAFTWGSILAALVSFAMFGLLFTMPQFASVVEGANALGTGLRLLPLIGGLMAGLRIGTPIAVKVGARPVIAAGFAIMAAGLLLGTATGVGTGFGFVATWLAIGGVGIGFVLPNVMNTAMGELPRDGAGVGSGVVMAVRQIGGTVAVAVLGTVLNSAYRSHLVTAGLPATAADAAHRSASGGVAAAAKLHSPDLLASVRSSLVHATSLTLIASAVVALLGVALATRLPGKTPAVGAEGAQHAESSGDVLHAAG